MDQQGLGDSHGNGERQLVHHVPPSGEHLHPHLLDCRNLPLPLQHPHVHDGNGGCPVQQFDNNRIIFDNNDRLHLIYDFVNNLSNIERFHFSDEHDHDHLVHVATNGYHVLDHYFKLFWWNSGVSVSGRPGDRASCGHCSFLLGNQALQRGPEPFSVHHTLET
jgi:hypothetical protein